MPSYRHIVHWLGNGIKRIMVDYDILIPGNYFCDLIFTGFPSFPALGSEVYTQNLTVTVGGVLNTVIALQRLNVNVGWLSQLGTDLFSRFTLETIEKEGVRTDLVKRVDESFQRVTAAVSYPEDRAFITYIDEAPSAVEMALAAFHKINFRQLHFTGLQLDPRTVELLDLATAHNIPVSMDCQHRPVTLDSPNVRDIISRLSLFMPNAKEARQLTGEQDLDAAAKILNTLVPLLVIKDGENGAVAWHHGERYYAPALENIHPVDTTGAGDVFNAGFLSAYLEGHALETCLRWGNICGGLSTLGHGGTSTAPRRTELENWLKAQS